MAPLAPTVGRFCCRFKRPLAAIQAHRRIERVGAHRVIRRDNKSAAGKALKDVREGDAADVNEMLKSKN